MFYAYILRKLLQAFLNENTIQYFKITTIVRAKVNAQGLGNFLECWKL